MSNSQINPDQYGAQKAREIADSQATKAQSGQSTFEQTAAHAKATTGVQVLTHLNQLLSKLQEGKGGGSYTATSDAEEGAETSAAPTSLNNQVLSEGMKTETQGLKEATTFLQAHGKNTEQLSGDQTKLNQILQNLAATPPKISEEDFHYLDNLLPQLREMAKSLPPKDQEAFNTLLQKMYNNIEELLHGQIRELSAKMAQGETQDSANKYVQSLNQLFQGKPPLQLTSKNTAEFYSALENLYATKSSLSPNQEDEVDSYLEKVMSVKVTKDGKGTTVGSNLVYAKAYSLIKSYLEKNPSGTMAESKAALKEIYQKMPEGALKKKFGIIFQQYANFFPRCVHVVNGKNVPVSSAEFFAPFEGALSGEGDVPPTLDANLFSGAANAQAAQSQALGKVLGDMVQRKNIASKAAGAAKIAANQAVQKSPQVTQKGTTNNTSLQSQFYNIILGHYMPKQESYLNTVASGLMWDNAKARIWNGMLNDTVGFSNAKSTFTFSQSLGTGKTSNYTVSLGGNSTESVQYTTYTGSPSGMKAKLSAEKTAAINHLQQVTTASTSVTNTLKQLGYTNGTYSASETLSQLKANLQKEGGSALDDSLITKYNLTLTKIQALGSQLASYQTDLETAKTNLEHLNSILSQMHIAPAYSFHEVFGEAATAFGKTLLPDEFTISYGSAPPEDLSSTPIQELPGITKTLTMGDVLEQLGEQTPTDASTADLPSMLSSAENAVVNGSTGEPNSGLGNIAQNFTTDSQNASNLSQSAQMKLQLTMTEVQQEWTIVSTALQILNQMYMSLAKAVYSL